MLCFISFCGYACSMAARRVPFFLTFCSQKSPCAGNGLYAGSTAAQACAQKACQCPMLPVK